MPYSPKNFRDVAYKASMAPSELQPPLNFADGGMVESYQGGGSVNWAGDSTIYNTQGQIGNILATPGGFSGMSRQLNMAKGGSVKSDGHASPDRMISMMKGEFSKRGLDFDKYMANRLAAKGTNGDTMLAHINPQEAAMLKRAGGSGDINPNTGLASFGYGSDSSNDSRPERGETGTVSSGEGPGSYSRNESSYSSSDHGGGRDIQAARDFENSTRAAEAQKAADVARDQSLDEAVKTAAWNQKTRDYWTEQQAKNAAETDAKLNAAANAADQQQKAAEEAKNAQIAREANLAENQAMAANTAYGLRAGPLTGTSPLSKVAEASNDVAFNEPSGAATTFTPEGAGIVPSGSFTNPPSVQAAIDAAKAERARITQEANRTENQAMAANDAYAMRAGPLTGQPSQVAQTTSPGVLQRVAESVVTPAAAADNPPAMTPLPGPVPMPPVRPAEVTPTAKEPAAPAPSPNVPMPTPRPPDATTPKTQSPFENIVKTITSSVENANVPAIAADTVTGMVPVVGPINMISKLLGGPSVGTTLFPGGGQANTPAATPGALNEAQQAAQTKMDTGVYLNGDDVDAMTPEQRDYAYKNGMLTVGKPTGDFFSDLFSGKLGAQPGTTDYPSRSNRGDHNSQSVAQPITPPAVSVVPPLSQSTTPTMDAISKSLATYAPRTYLGAPSNPYNYGYGGEQTYYSAKGGAVGPLSQKRK
jgi:hypothetical protein